MHLTRLTKPSGHVTGGRWRGAKGGGGEGKRRRRKAGSQKGKKEEGPPAWMVWCGNNYSVVWCRNLLYV